MVQGRIVNIVQVSGAIAELEDSVRGFIPISELELGYTKQVKDVVSVDDELDLRIIEFDENNQSIRLSLKAVRSNLWKVGSVVRGRIINIIETDVLVRLAYGIDGFIPASELSWTKEYRTPSKFFEVGDEVNVMVLDIDPAKQYIELSYNKQNQILGNLLRKNTQRAHRSGKNRQYHQFWCICRTGRRHQGFDSYP